MLSILWAVIVILVIAAVLGFTGVVSALANIAWWLIVAAVVIAVINLFTGRRTVA